MIHFHIITLFPEAFDSYLKSSIISRAIQKRHIWISFYNPRDFSDTNISKRYRRVDSRPYGGGPGMVMEARPVLRAVQKAIGKKKRVLIIFFERGGSPFDAKKARALAEKKHIVLIAGHYEGIDARVKKALKADALSIGPYTLTGGELPALVLVDAISRYIPGVLGNVASIEEDRVAGREVYARPEALTYKGKRYAVPKVLLSGHHRKIEEWKKELSRKKKEA